MTLTDALLAALIPAVPALIAAFIGWLNGRKAKQTKIAVAHVNDKVQAIDVKVDGNLTSLNLRIGQLTEALHTGGVPVPVAAPVNPPPETVPPTAHP